MRVRYNNAAGALGSPALTNTATTITFASAPSFATLVAPNYIPLVLDPPQGPASNPSFEIVYLTAYTSGATTGTILRGQEGTTGVAHNIGAIWAQAPTYNDLIGEPPIGSCIPYAGTGDPPETTWLIADGRLIDKTVYSDFFNRVGHAYNAGVDPGSNKVKIPDKRGRASMGAIDMGTGVPAGQSQQASPYTQASTNNARVWAVRAVSSQAGGEVYHASATNEMPVHNHWNNLSQTNLDHAHVVPISWSWNDPTHSHWMGSVDRWNSANRQPYSSGAAFTCAGAGGSGTDGAGTGISATWYTGDGNNGWSRSITGSYGGGAWYHGHTIPYDGGTTPSGGASPGSVISHNNVSPYEADCYIVRVA